MSTPVSDKLVTVAGLKEAYDALTEEPFVVDITSGQWSGSGSDYYITVNASNITANSILVVDYDKNSQQYLKGPVWAVPAAGSFTIHTSAVPTGTVKILVRFPGTMGEANYQVLADVYSKSQTYSKTEAVAKADIVNNLTSTATDKPLSANMGRALNDNIIGRKPTTLLRPISGNQITDWTYTVPHDGTLYLVFVGTIRSYCSVLWNDAYIAAVAFADNSNPLANTVTVNVKKNDTIKVVGLNTNCYLISSQTAFIANGVLN